MSADAKKHYGLALALLFLGVLALYGGVRWLAFIVPVAALVLYAAAPALRGGRN